LEGELVLKADVVEEFSDFLSGCTPLLESLVDDIAKEVSEEYRVTVHQIMQNGVERFFKKLSGWKFKGDV